LHVWAEVRKGRGLEKEESRGREKADEKEIDKRIGRPPFAFQVLKEMQVMRGKKGDRPSHAIEQKATVGCNIGFFMLLGAVVKEENTKKTIEAMFKESKSGRGIEKWFDDFDAVLRRR
jgi:hypothetical protein